VLPWRVHVGRAGQVWVVWLPMSGRVGLLVARTWGGCGRTLPNAGESIPVCVFRPWPGPTWQSVCTVCARSIKGGPKKGDWGCLPGGAGYWQAFLCLCAVGTRAQPVD
jgi:hypothetical protein